MSATLVFDPSTRAPVQGGLRIGRWQPQGEGMVSAEWRLKRNCSISPAQSMACFAALCVVSLGIGTMFWWQGAPLVMPFAGLELLAVGGLLLLYARHATDSEVLRLTSGGLVIERVSGQAVERVELSVGQVQVDAGRGAGALVEVFDQAHRIRIGQFIRPELRRQLAEELRWALRRGHAVSAPGEPHAHGDTHSILNRTQAGR